jgi:hypothetical protein
MIAHDSDLNGATSAPDPTSAPHTHLDGPQRSTAHPATSPGWHWTDFAALAVSLVGFVVLGVTLIWALTTPTSQVHYELSPQRTERTLPDWTPGPAPVLPTPIPMVLSDQHDDPRAVVLVPAWSVVR